MKKLTAALALALAASPALATNGLRMTAFSPVNASVGGAGVAHAWDASALVVNPATMADLGARVDFGAAYFPTTVTYSATNSYIGTGIPALEQIGALIVNQPNVTLTSDFPAVPIPNIGLVVPFGKDVRLGVGMASMAGVGTDYAANLFSSTVATSYYSFRFPIGASWQVLDILSLGASLNGAWALMGYTLGASVGLPPHPVASSFGAGFTLGAKVKALPFLSVGATYESPTWFQPFKFNVGCANPLGAIPVNPACGPLGVPGGQEQLQFDLPYSFSGGLEASLLEGALILVGDVQWVAWSTTLGPNMPSFVGGSATLTSQFFPFNTDWSDQWIFKVGAQYTLPVMEDRWRLRAGYNYGKAPLNPSQALENIAFPAIAESHVTVGLGFATSKSIALNFSSVIGLKNTVSGTGSLPDLSGLVGQPVPAGTLSYSTSVSGYTLELGVSVTY